MRRIAEIPTSPPCDERHRRASITFGSGQERACRRPPLVGPETVSGVGSTPTHGWASLSVSVRQTVQPGWHLTRLGPVAPGGCGYAQAGSSWSPVEAPAQILAGMQLGNPRLGPRLNPHPSPPRPLGSPISASCGAWGPACSAHQSRVRIVVRAPALPSVPMCTARTPFFAGQSNASRTASSAASCSPVSKNSPLGRSGSANTSSG